MRLSAVSNDGLRSCALFRLQEGGGRKGLPKSFLNRFSRVHIDLLESADMMKIAGAPPLAGVSPTTALQPAAPSVLWLDTRVSPDIMLRS